MAEMCGKFWTSRQKLQQYKYLDIHRCTNKALADYRSADSQCLTMG